MRAARRQATLEWCQKCRKNTRWIPLRGGFAERCDGCGDRFPCASSTCGHNDCAERRRENVKGLGERVFGGAP